MKTKQQTILKQTCFQRKVESIWMRIVVTIFYITFPQTPKKGKKGKTIGFIHIQIKSDFQVAEQFFESQFFPSLGRKNTTVCLVTVLK